MSSRFLALMFSACACAFLCAYVFWRYGTQRLHRQLAVLVAGAGAFSVFEAGLAAAGTEASASEWIRYTSVLPYFTILAFYRFSVIFSQNEKKTWIRLLTWTALAVAIVDVLGRAFGLLPMATLTLVPGEGWFPIADPVYIRLYVPIMLILMASSGVLLFRRWRNTPSAFERRQFAYMALALGSGVLLSFFNLLPNLAFVASFASLSISLVLVYGMTRYQVLDIQLLVQKGATLALVSLLLAVVAAGLILIDVRVWGGSGWFALFVGALAFASLYPLFQGMLRRGLGAWIGRGPMDIGAELLDYSLLNIRHPRLQSQLEATLQRLGNHLGLSQASILLPDKQGQLSTWHAWPPAAEGVSPDGLDPKSGVGRRLALAPRGLELDSLGWARRYESDAVQALEPALDQECREFLRAHGAQAAFGLVGRQRLVGVLLVGRPSSGRALEVDEQKFLSALAAQLAALVENAALHGRVEHADRLSTIGTLGASLAHELRNPLASISVFVQMLPDRHQEAAFVEKFDRVVTAELAKLTHLTEQLLNLARPATRAPQVVDLGVLCQRLLQLVSFQFRSKEVRLTLDTPEGTLVHGVEEELSQVLLNLLLNALDASKAGTQVQVQLSGPAGWAELRVLDQGPGLSQDQLARIFEPFFTTKEHGNGLGLATSQNIVQSFGGTLDAENRPEGGAVFTVRLPKAQAGKVEELVEPGWAKR